MNNIQMMQGWVDKAWWVVESAFLHFLNKGFRACLGDLPEGIPRRPEKLAILFKRSSAIVGPIVPTVTIAKGNSIHPT